MSSFTKIPSRPFLTAPRTARTMLKLGWLAIGLILTASPLRAETCRPDETVCRGIRAPWITLSSISPGMFAPDSTSRDTLSLSMFASDFMSAGLDVGTLTLTRNGTDMTSWYTTSGNLSDPWGGGTSLQATGPFVLVTGANLLVARVCELYASTVCHADTLTVYYVPEAAMPAQAAPVATLAQSNASRLLDDCATCASKVLGYSTPAEIVMGAPRAVALRYSSEVANPTGFVEVDARIRSTSLPTWLSIRLKKSNGTFVTLSNGATEAFVAVSDTGTYRLGAQFDASGSDYPQTGSYPFDVIIGSYWGSGTWYLSDTLQARVLIQKEVASPFGVGWTVAGVARLYSQTDGVVLTDGAGGLAFFEQISCSGSPQVCAYTSPKGNFAVLNKSAPVSPYSTVWHLTSRDGGASHFTSDGLLVESTDRLGNAMRFDYETPSGQATRLWKVKTLVRSASAYERATEFTYAGSPGMLSAITLPDGRASRFTITSGELRTILDPDSLTALTATYASGRLIRASGRNGAADTVLYDAFGQVAEHKSPAVLTEADGSIRISTVVASLRARLLTNQGTTTGGSPAAAVRADSAYLKVTAPNGTSVASWMHASGAASRVETREASGKKIYSATKFNADYLPISTEETGRGPTLLTWSGARLLQVENSANGAITKYSYVKYDQIDSVTQNGSRVLRNYYSSDSLLPDSTRSDSANTVRYKYDTYKRMVSVRDGSQAVDSLTYEATFGNVETGRRTNGWNTPTVTTYVFDGSGRTQQVTDPLGNVTTVYYDRLNRDTLTIQPLGARTRKKYEDDKRRYTVTDPMTQGYTDSTNALGWTVLQRDPRGNSDTYGYDRLGRPVRRTNRNGAVTTIARDSLGRVTRRIAGTDTSWFRYDTASKWVAMRNAASRDSMIFDASGRLLGIHVWRGSSEFTFAFDYTDVNLTGKIWIRRYSSGSQQWVRTVGYGYDANDKLNQITDFAGKQTSIQYNKFALPTVVSLPHSRSITTVYDAANRPDRQYYAPSGLNLSLETLYQRDTVDRVSSEGRGDEQRYFTYDELGRLSKYLGLRPWTNVEYIQIPNDPYNDCPGCFILDSMVTTGVDTLRQELFQYDSVANRRDRSAVLEFGNRVTSVDGYSIRYDSAGFMVEKSKWGDTLKFSWNGVGQLVQVYSKYWTTVKTTAYAYDAAGRRVQKTVDGVVTNYLVVGDQVFMELDASHAIVAEYTYYPGSDTPHSMRRGGKMYYYAQDLHGNVLGLIDTTGALKASYEYYPYGELVWETGPIANPYRYKAREWDAEAELYFMRARYYDPHLGRFISEDPIGLAGGMNTQAFVGGDPVNRGDPSGLDWVCVGWAPFGPNQIQICNQWAWTLPASYATHGREWRPWSRDCWSSFDCERDDYGSFYHQDADRGSAETIGPAESRTPEYKTDPCKVYGTPSFLNNVCSRVHGPNSHWRNAMVSECLANKWVVKTQGMPTSAGKKVGHLVVDHWSCYGDYAYGWYDFAFDFIVGTGERGRPSVAPPFVVTCLQIGCGAPD